MYIVSISVEKREKEVPGVQETLTRYGDNILARLGVHNCEKERKGLIIVVYEAENIEEFVEELNQIDNVTVNFMEA